MSDQETPIKPILKPAIKRKVKKPTLTPRQRKFIIEKAKGKTNKEAARIAGYDAPSYQQQASMDLKKLKENGTFAELMNQFGITDESLIEDYNRLRKFSRSTIVRKIDGDEIVEVADGQVQLGTLKIGLQLKNHLTEKEPTPATIIINMADYNAKKD